MPVSSGIDLSWDSKCLLVLHLSSLHLHNVDYQGVAELADGFCSQMRNRIRLDYDAKPLIPPFLSNALRVPRITANLMRVECDIELNTALTVGLPRTNSLAFPRGFCVILYACRC